MNKNQISLLVVGTLLAAACGDNKTAADAAKHIDAHIQTDSAGGFPAAPTLGTQIDRLGRPAINTALNGAFVADAAAKNAQKDAYNAATAVATWSGVMVKTGTTAKQEFQKNLAIFDAADKGITTIAGNGCGNAALYAGPAGANSYAALASFLVDDRLYVDTAKATCNNYLSLEVEVATGGQVLHTECGGRTPTHDVIDTSYSLLAAGLGGFNPNTFAPLLGDGVSAHGDVSTTAFPFLGAPH